ncbi:MAG: HAMP domain-containing histidine kinase, partial [Opitutaceae bacterium]|nr:HAMP domain-containing histidine kinase [Opitutaceae bacterium]
LMPQAERQATVELKKSQVEQQQRAVLADENYYVGNRPSPARARQLVRGSAPESAPASFEVDSSNHPEAGASVAEESLVPTDSARVGGYDIEAPVPLDAPRADDTRPQHLDARASTAGPIAATPAGSAGLFKGEIEKALVAAPSPPAEPEPIPGALAVRWIGEELFLVRPVSGSTTIRAQAVWLDWPELRAWLLTRVTDLIPDAALEPADGTGTSTLDEASRRLAFLPVRLQPGVIALPGASSWSPLQISLAIAWVLAGVGVVALALLLAGTLRLSERRGAFVSAVTHELRTPLTTFRMYTEMLASGMVPDEGKRRSYLDTLRKEAERLSHLVENVLSYARLERGRASRRIEDTTPASLFSRIEERLRQRAEQGGLTLTITFEPGADGLPLRTDTTAFEQIVFNLVDNAAKYARRPDGGGTLAIMVCAGARGRVVVRVADQGPGIAAGVRGRLFQPFSKSAAEAAHSQPGVGLGLALSRRLARDELHGELALERTGPDGTVFRLEV